MNEKRLENSQNATKRKPMGIPEEVILTPYDRFKKMIINKEEVTEKMLEEAKEKNEITPEQVRDLLEYATFTKKYNRI